MDERLKDGEARTQAPTAPAPTAPSDHKPPVDPLRRVFTNTLGRRRASELSRTIFIPREAQTSRGTTVFRTSDREVYAWLTDGSIRRSRQKAKGKAARRAEREARRRASARTKATP